MFDGIFLSLDIRTFMRVLVILLALGSAVTFFIGMGGIRESRRMKYYRLRRSRLVAGWRMLFISFAIDCGNPGCLTLWRTSCLPFLYRFAHTLTDAYSYITPTITETPTITLTPRLPPHFRRLIPPLPPQHRMFPWRWK